MVENLPLLERLLVTAVEDGAAQLRRGVLLNQLVRTLDRMRTERIPATPAAAEAAAEQAEAGIGRMLDLLGAPESHLDELAANDPARPAVEAFHRGLEKLEEARGGSFAAPATGSVHRHSQNVIDGFLNPLRAAARERAEALVDRAMADRQVVDRDEFERTVFDTEVVDAATAQAVARLTHYLERRVGVAAADVAADLEAVSPRRRPPSPAPPAVATAGPSSGSPSWPPYCSSPGMSAPWCSPPARWPGSRSRDCGTGWANGRPRSTRRSSPGPAARRGRR